MAAGSVKRRLAVVNITLMVLVSCSPDRLKGPDVGFEPVEATESTSMLEESVDDGQGPEPPEEPSAPNATPARRDDSHPSSTVRSGSDAGFGGVQGTTLPSGEVRLRGIVGALDTAQARIVLQEPVSGYSVIATTPATEFRLSEGEPGAFADLQVGGPISATGAAGGDGVMIAELVVLLDA